MYDTLVSLERWKRKRPPHSSHLVYMARIALRAIHMIIDGKAVDLVPGMAVTAGIKTGKRRLLDYLLSPFHRYSHDVMRER